MELTGLRMMPTSPWPPLKFRTNASISNGSHLFGSEKGCCSEVSRKRQLINLTGVICYLKKQY
jgi:hypothetical protein